MSEGPYRTPGKDGDDQHCRDCGDVITFGGERCIRCGVIARRVWRDRGRVAFVLLIGFVGWIALSAFTTLAGYLLDLTDGELSYGAQLAGTIGFCVGAVPFGIMLCALIAEWLDTDE